MTATVKTFCVNSASVIAAVSDRVLERVPRANNPAGKYDMDWREIKADGLTGKIVQLAARYDGALVALTTAGLFALDRSHAGYAATWRAINPPGEAL